MMATASQKTQNAHAEFVEEVEIAGHIIDSLILPKVLDLINAAGGTFTIKRIAVGQTQSDPSFALIEVGAEAPRH